MKVFFDLDDVLFDTRSFVGAISDIFERRGVSRDAYARTYGLARVVGNDVVKVYSFREHVAILQGRFPELTLDAEFLFGQYEALFFDTSRYVFPDVAEVLSDLKKCGASLYVVSFGIPKVQRAKIDGSGLVSFLDDFFVGTEPKSRMIANVVGDGDDAWFIDDQPKFIDDVKTVYPFIRTVQMRRKNGRFVNDIHSKSDFVAEDMADVKRLLGNFNQ